MRTFVISLLLLLVTSYYQTADSADQSSGDGFYATVELLNNGSIAANIVAQEVDTGAIVEAGGTYKAGSKLHKQILVKFPELQPSMTRQLDLKEATWLLKLIN